MKSRKEWIESRKRELFSAEAMAAVEAVDCATLSWEMSEAKERYAAKLVLDMSHRLWNEGKYKLAHEWALATIEILFGKDSPVYEMHSDV